MKKIGAIGSNKKVNNKSGRRVGAKFRSRYTSNCQEASIISSFILVLFLLLGALPSSIISCRCRGCLR